MKKSILFTIILFLSLTSIVYAQDRVRVQVQYRKALWVCPKCAQEDITDLNVGTPNVYEHTCSKCGQWFNSFKEYNGVASYSQADYASLSQNALNEEKTARVDAWIYDIKHPAPYVEPDKATLERMLAEKQAECLELQRKIDEKTIITP